MSTKIDFEQRQREREEIERLVPAVEVDRAEARRIAARKKLLRDQLAQLLAQEKKAGKRKDRDMR